jgi:hypothetical protein
VLWMIRACSLMVVSFEDVGVRKRRARGVPEETWWHGNRASVYVVIV